LSERELSVITDTKAKVLYLATLHDRLVDRCGYSPLIAIAVEAAELAWDESERVNYARGVIDGQENLAKALHVMQGRMER